jgi:PAS domain S-box-containing protein
VKNSKADLRNRAEAVIAKRPHRAAASKVGHELDVHQIELELQNEELLEARAALETALALYREVFDFAPIGYVALDHGGAIVEINLAGARYLGLPRARLLTRPFAAFVAPGSIDVFDRYIADTSAREDSPSTELDLCSDDRMVPFKLTATRLARAGGPLLLAFEDISARRAKERELADSEEALRVANERKDEFLAMLSHELRNPLSPIRTSVFLLQAMPQPSADATNAVEIIDRSSAHLARLVDDLLDVTRITRGKIDLKPGPLDLCGLVRNVVADHQPRFSRAGIEMGLDCRKAEVWIVGDGARLVQVLTNLLGNAEKFTPKGGSVQLELDALDGDAVLRVRDTGIGIAPNVIARLFEPFMQAPQAIDRSPGGLGLGLAMVKSLVEMHGGSVTLASEGIGKGTEVVVRLPSFANPAERPAAAQRAATTFRRVLIIEDLPDVAHSLRDVLEIIGHTVEIAYDGRTGIEGIKQMRPEVVLCDLGLPDMDGYQVAQAVRANDDLTAVCLVALSGYARPEDVARAKAAGFALHIAKPPKLEDLERVLANPPRC